MVGEHKCCESRSGYLYCLDCRDAWPCEDARRIAHIKKTEAQLDNATRLAGATIAKQNARVKELEEEVAGLRGLLLIEEEARVLAGGGAKNADTREG